MCCNGEVCQGGWGRGEGLREAARAVGEGVGVWDLGGLGEGVGRFIGVAGGCGDVGRL